MYISRLLSFLPFRFDPSLSTRLIDSVSCFLPLGVLRFTDNLGVSTLFNFIDCAAKTNRAGSLSRDDNVGRQASSLLL